tara:strand:+ start:109 stop:894 length:786 start_codon:yes stop_codon:yes gene_type:complete
MLCHTKNDEATHSPTFQLPVYKCPVCRIRTIIPANQRQLNVVVDKICIDLYPQEYKRLLDCSGVPPLTESISDDDVTTHWENESPLNLAAIASNAQDKLAIETYNTIVPLLIDAARKGKSFISIVDKDTVEQIEICIQPLSSLLFKKNNIFKITCTPNECSIKICKSSARWRRDRTNTRYETTNTDNLPTLPTLPTSHTSNSLNLETRPRPASVLETRPTSVQEGVNQIRSFIRMSYRPESYRPESYRPENNPTDSILPVP